MQAKKPETPTFSSIKEACQYASGHAKAHVPVRIAAAKVLTGGVPDVCRLLQEKQSPQAADPDSSPSWTLLETCLYWTSKAGAQRGCGVLVPYIIAAFADVFMALQDDLNNTKSSLKSAEKMAQNWKNLHDDLQAKLKP